MLRSVPWGGDGWASASSTHRTRAGGGGSAWPASPSASVAGSTQAGCKCLVLQKAVTVLSSLSLSEAEAFWPNCWEHPQPGPVQRLPWGRGLVPGGAGGHRTRGRRGFPSRTETRLRGAHEGRRGQLLFRPASLCLALNGLQLIHPEVPRS